MFGWIAEGSASLATGVDVALSPGGRLLLLDKLLRVLAEEIGFLVELADENVLRLVD